MIFFLNSGLDNFGLLLKNVNCETKNNLKFNSIQIFAM
jgi:hypothetical protein